MIKKEPFPNSNTLEVIKSKMLLKLEVMSVFKKTIFEVQSWIKC